MAHVSDRDLELARRLPDDFTEGGSGSAVHRLIELVGENWVRYEIKARTELVEALLPILERLLEPGAKVTDLERGVSKGIPGFTPLSGPLLRVVSVSTNRTFSFPPSRLKNVYHTSRFGELSVLNFKRGDDIRLKKYIR